MARFSKKALWIVQNRALNRLIRTVVEACTYAAHVESEPLIYPPAPLRAAMLAMGASRNHTDGGFESKDHMDRFLDGLRANVKRFEATHSANEGMPNGKLVAISRSRVREGVWQRMFAIAVKE